MLQNFLGQPMVPYDPKDYYTGFYEAFEYHRRFELLSRLLSSILAFLSLCLSSFTIAAMLSSGNTNKAYRRVIIEHISLSTFLSGLFPLSGLNIIANYQAIIIEKWWTNMPVLAFITACFILFGYFAVVVFCVVSFLLNFVTSTNIQVNLPILRNFEAQQILRMSVILFSIVTTFLSVALFYEILNYNMSDIITITIQFDPRLSQVFSEKNIHTLVVTYGMLYYVRLLAVISTSFVLGSFCVIYYNYMKISQQRSRTSKLVNKQQKLIIRIEILYYFMILLSYAPPGLVLVLSLFLKALPESWERFPIFLLISIPLQLLPILDCLLHVLAIRAYRETAFGLIKRHFFKEVTVRNCSISRKISAVPK